MRPKKLETPIEEAVDAGLTRFLSASSGLKAALQNLDRAREPALKERLGGALARMQQRGICRLGQQPRKFAR